MLQKVAGSIDGNMAGDVAGNVGGNAGGKKMSNTTNEISREMVENITGSPRHKIVADFVNALLTKNTAEAISAVEEAVKQNSDMKVFTDLSLIEIRRMMLGEVAKIGPNIGGGSATNMVLQIRRALYALIVSRQRIDSSSIPSLPLELAILEVTA
jgi:DNA polymerase III gamma/tau subunit